MHDKDEEEQPVVVTNSGSPARTISSQSRIRAVSTPSMHRSRADSFVAAALPTYASTVNTSLLPPITRMTLRELDYACIERNIQIRHDLLLDATLKIKQRPLSSQLQAQRDDYWADLRRDIQACTVERSMPLRIKLFFNEVHELMRVMYPNSVVVKDELLPMTEVGYVTQQISHGAFDLLGWARFLGYAMKCNCAPKRDAIVDVMVESAEKGDFIQCAMLVMELLELMKLDLANHHLQRMRPTIGKGLAARESRLLQGRPLPLTCSWIAENRKEDVRLTFIEGIVNLVVCQADERVPETLHLDRNRVSTLAAECRDLCILAGLMSVGKSVDKKLIKALLAESDPLLLATFLHVPVERVRAVTDTTLSFLAVLRARLLALMRQALTRRSGNRRELDLGVFKPCRDEVGAFLNKLCSLAALNWTVHGALYADVYARHAMCS